MGFLRFSLGALRSIVTLACGRLRRPLPSRHDAPPQPHPRSLVMSIRVAAITAAIGLLLAVAPPALAQEGKTTELADGLKYTDTKIGDGAVAEKGFIVSVNYTGWL